MEAAEEYALQQRRPYLRLEVRKDNPAAIALYEKRGYRLFAQTPDYYEDHQDALRYQKRLLFLPDNAERLHLPWVQQTTPFTCGPACLMMALAALKQQPPSTTEELLLWREATTIFMTAGHGGCHPMGLALAARQRGLEARVWCNQTGPLFVDSVRDTEKKAVITTLHNYFVETCKAQSLPVCYEDFSAADLDDAIAAGSIVLVLISTWRLDGRKAPHWVAISGSDEECFYIHDPDPGKTRFRWTANMCPSPGKSSTRCASTARPSCARRWFWEPQTTPIRRSAAGGAITSIVTSHEKRVSKTKT